jgi:hypothetical protein
MITDDYRRMQETLHASDTNYGSASVHMAPIVARYVQAANAKEVLDYGAGKGRLSDALCHALGYPVIVRRYDPAMPQWSATPEPAPFVCCIDVLEHIEPQCLLAVLDDLKRVTLGYGFFSVHTGPAKKILADGRNAHLIQRPPLWWLPLFFDRFEVEAYQRAERGFYIFVSRKPAAASTNQAAA